MFSPFFADEIHTKISPNQLPTAPHTILTPRPRARAAQNVGGTANSPTFSRFAAFSALISCPKGTAVLGTGWDGHYDGAGTISVMAPILLTTYMGISVKHNRIQ